MELETPEVEEDWLIDKGDEVAAVDEVIPEDVVEVVAETGPVALLELREDEDPVDELETAQADAGTLTKSISMQAGSVPTNWARTVVPLKQNRASPLSKPALAHWRAAPSNENPVLMEPTGEN